MYGLIVSDESLHRTSMEGLTVSESLVMTPHKGPHVEATRSSLTFYTGPPYKD